MCGNLKNKVKMHVLAPSLTPRCGILVRMVSCGMIGMAGVWLMVVLLWQLVVYYTRAFLKASLLQLMSHINRSGAGLRLLLLLWLSRVSASISY